MSESQNLTEREVAKRLLENVDNLTKNYEGLTEQIDSIRTQMKNVEGIDTAGVSTFHERHWHQRIEGRGS